MNYDRLVHRRWSYSRNLALVSDQPAHSPAGGHDGQGTDKQRQSGAVGDLLSGWQTNVPGRQCLFHVACWLPAAVRVILCCLHVCLVSTLKNECSLQFVRHNGAPGPWCPAWDTVTWWASVWAWQHPTCLTFSDLTTAKANQLPTSTLYTSYL